MSSIIEWCDDNETGYVVNGSSRYLCYRPSYGIKACIWQFCLDLIKDPEMWQKRKDIIIYECAIDKLRMIQPKIPDHYLFQIIKNIESIIPRKLEEAVKITNIKNDFVFLALLGLKRNWKKDCAKCFTEKRLC